jgi:hypothetical protein
MELGLWFPRFGGIMALEFGSHVEKSRKLVDCNGKKFWKLQYEWSIFLVIERDVELT